MLKINLSQETFKVYYKCFPHKIDFLLINPNNFSPYGNSFAPLCYLQLKLRRQCPPLHAAPAEEAYCIISDCVSLLMQTAGEISPNTQSVLDNIAHGKLDIQIDGLMIGILIRKMVVTQKQTLAIHFLDSTIYRHRLGATPMRKRIYNIQQEHSLILVLSAEGCSAREISQRMGISINTVRSFLRRHRNCSSVP